MSKTLDLAIAALEKLGASDDVIAELKKDDDTAAEAIKVDELVTDIATTQKDIVLADESHFTDKRKQVIAEILSARTLNLIKESKGKLTKAEVEALPEKDRFDLAVKLLIKKLSEDKSGSSDAESKIQELEEELVKSQERIKEFEETIIPGKDQEWESKFKQRDLDQKIQAAYNSLAVDGTGKPRLIAKPELLFPGTLAALNGKYDVKYGENGVEIYDKGKNTLARKNSKPLTLEQAFDDINTEMESYKKADTVPSNTRKQGDGKEKVVIVAGSPQDKLRKDIEKRKAEQTA